MPGEVLDDMAAQVSLENVTRTEMGTQILW